MSSSSFFILEFVTWVSLRKCFICYPLIVKKKRKRFPFYLRFTSMIWVFLFQHKMKSVMLHLYSLRTTVERSLSGSININFLTKQGYPISDKNSQFAEKTEKIKWEEKEEVEREARIGWDNQREKQREDRGDSLKQTAQWQVSVSYSPLDTAVYRNTLEVTLYPAILGIFLYTCWLLYQLSHSPGHHLLLLVGGMPTTADWMDCCGQEVQSMVFKVLIHQWQDDLRGKWHGY